MEVIKILLLNIGKIEFKTPNTKHKFETYQKLPAFRMYNTTTSAIWKIVTSISCFLPSDVDLNIKNVVK